MIVVCIIIVSLITGNVFFKSSDTKINGIAVNEYSSFDENRAYDMIEQIASDFQCRIFGSDEVGLLKDHIKDSFLQYGLECETQDFTSWRPDKKKFYLKFDIVDNDVGLFRDSFGDIIERVDGTNVIGISKGKTDRAVLIGAHMDISTGIEGAEDNASGVGTMMEIAREVSQTEHYFTYYFVAFDGEEAQEKGSDYFVKNFRNIKDIDFAIILDQVGYSKADTLTTYGTYGGFEETPLYTILLAEACLNKSCGKEIFFSNSCRSSFLSHVVSKAFGSANTDCNPFYSVGIPAIGLMAIDSETGKGPIVHTTNDNMDVISRDTLKMSGNTVMSMITSIENDRSIVEKLNDHSDYVLNRNTFLDSKNIMIFKVTVLIVSIVLAVLTLIQTAERFKFIHLAKYVGGVSIAIVGACFAVFILKTELASNFINLPVFWLLLMIGVFIALIITVVNRLLLREDGVSFEVSCYNKLLLILLMGVYYLSGLFEYGLLVFSVLMISVVVNECCYRIKAVKYVLLPLTILFMLVLGAASFNVFIRGADTNRFMILHILNVINVIMIINTFLNFNRTQDINANQNREIN
ncbi:MAG: M28 family metallopeptidase [Hominimerdicola sp.]